MESKGPLSARTRMSFADQGVNVQVILRCRPCNEQELANRVPQVIRCNEPGREVTLYQNVGGKVLGRTFHFDKVFGPETGQEKLYAHAVHPIVEEVLEGFNCTIFAYGQTGTGKTFTMEGTLNDRPNNETVEERLSGTAGVIPRAIAHIFEFLDKANNDYTVKCSFLELYNEETTDLLAVGDSRNSKLRIMEDRDRVVIQGLEEIVVKNAHDIFTLLDRGSAKRKTAETLLNKQSSRSHSVFIITAHMREITVDGEEVIKTGKLYLVDLAGSENISRSGAVDVRAKEAGLINKSLLTLGRVITALVEQSGHVPYRDSKLTRLLRDSLGGKTKTCIIATIAPTVQCAEETLSTLDYAHRAKNIRNKPEINQKVSKTAHIKELNAEIDRLKAELWATREKNGVYMPLDQYNQQQTDYNIMKARMNDVESEIDGLRQGFEAELTEAKSEAEEVKGQLEEAVEALRLARQGIEERDFLIGTHERSEDALAGHAVTLCHELQLAANDVTSLFSTLHEHETQRVANSEAVKGLNTTIGDRMTAMQASVKKLVDEQGSWEATAQDSLKTLLAQRDEQLVALQAQLDMLKGALGNVVATGQRGAQSLEDNGSRGLNDVNALHQGYASDVRASAAAAKEAIDGTHAQLVAGLKQQGEQLEAYVAQQRDATKAMLAAASAVLASATQSLQSINASTNACLTAAAAGFTTQHEQLDTFQTKLGERLEEGQSELAVQISQLLQGFVMAQRAEVAAALDGMREQLASSREQLVKDVAVLNSTSTEAIGALQERGTEAKAAGEEAFRVLNEHQEAMQQAVAGSTTSAAELGSAVNEYATAQGDKLTAHSDALSKAVGSSAQALRELSVSVKEECSTAGTKADDIHGSVLTAVGQQHSATREGIMGLGYKVKAGHSRVSDFSGQHCEALGSLATDVQDSVHKQYKHSAPEREAPPQRTIDVPPVSWVDDLRTPPPDVVLAEFHRQKALLAAAGVLLEPSAEANGNGTTPMAASRQATATAHVTVPGAAVVKGSGTENMESNMDPDYLLAVQTVQAVQVSDNSAPPAAVAADGTKIPKLNLAAAKVPSRTGSPRSARVSSMSLAPQDAA